MKQHTSTIAVAMCCRERLDWNVSGDHRIASFA
jgi:hypothetical protein